MPGRRVIDLTAVKRLFLAFAVFFAIAPAAHAAITVTTSTTFAGQPAKVTIDTTFASTPASVALHLPPGLVGNPKAAALCTQAQFNSVIPTCPSGSQVGTATANGSPLTSGPIYNLTPNAGEPARLGIAIDGFVKNQAAVSLRSDGGLDSTIAQLQTGGLSVSEMKLDLDSSFMTLPTACIPATVTVNDQTSAPFTPTNCEAVPFAPSVAA